ncbi:hypothetical protein GUJ93_ZPchr0005g16217 [Zizania palustris]|uniref:Uncharacterized protein n=1 Tax=Zizania palustris TaxID=103762 RepID=A0A8J5SQK9_ZIZPA|nr:hypothetical protein GUJ93_ZPchr0005g16217 [Zizania palustris]
MGSGDGMKELIEKLAAKIDDLKTSLDKLAPLARVAEQLATLPSKVVVLQSSAFENQEQVRALNLAIPRAENAQREGRAHAEENGNTTGEGSINRASLEENQKGVKLSLKIGTTGPFQSCTKENPVASLANGSGFVFCTGHRPSYRFEVAIS